MDGEVITRVETDAQSVLSEPLHKWLESNAQSERSDFVKSIGYASKKGVEGYFTLADEWGGRAFACLLIQGYALAQVQRADPSKVAEYADTRGMPRSTAHDRITLFRRLAKLKTQASIGRAAQLGSSRIGVLGPAIHDDGVVALLEKGSGGGFTFDHVAKSSVSAIRKDLRDREKKAHDEAADDKDVSGEVLDAAAAAIKQDPRWLVIARSELLSNVMRARLELERARHLVTELLDHNNDVWEKQRIELVHASFKIVEASRLEAEALAKLIFDRFGRAATDEFSGAYTTLGNSLLSATEELCAEQADSDLTTRGRIRSRATKSRGAIPKSLESVIAQAKKVTSADDE